MSSTLSDQKVRKNTLMLEICSRSGKSTEKQQMYVALKDYVYCFSGLKKEQREANRITLHA
jgi:hypothetical protein